MKTPTPHLSLLLLTRNESENIKKYWTWLNKCPVVSEIIVVDDNSTDDTINVINKLKIKNLKLKIISRGLDSDFSAQRQFGLSHASNDWILWLDADEQPSPELIKFLNHFDFNQNYVYSFPRLDFFLGRQLLHGETGEIFLVRLFPGNFGSFTGKVHETWQSQLPAKIINHPIFHYSHPDLQSFIAKIDFYTTIRSQELFRQHLPVTLAQIIFYPLAKFLQNYIFRLGFLDSTRGIIMALCMSFHSFLVRAKLWHLSQK